MAFLDSGPDTKDFQAEITIDTNISAPTVIYSSFDSPQPLNWYPKGYKFNVSSPSKIKPKYEVKRSKN